MSITRLRILTMSEKPRSEERAATFKARGFYMGAVGSAVAAATAFLAEAAASAPRCRKRQLRLPRWKAVAAATALHTY
jgi:hypothetical protein